MKLIQDCNLKEYNSYHLEASCKSAFFPESYNDLREFYLNDTGTRKVLLGNGNNIILARDYYPDSFLIFNKCFDRIVVRGTDLEAEAGATLGHLSEIALENSLTGMEAYYDIPSSAGGAVVMNAGASGFEIKDILTGVEYYDPGRNEFYELSRDQNGFSYRDSFFQQNPHLVVTRIYLRLKDGNKQSIRSGMDSIKLARWQKQPRDLPSAGSVFKRPKGMFVGKMVEELGLRGFAVGDAMVSQKHAGFIVNRGTASGKDILDLIEIVRNRVEEAYGIKLEIEQRVID